MMVSMKLRLFTMPTCPMCPAAKELVNRLKEKRNDIDVEILDMSQPENYTAALMVQIVSTPSFVINNTPIFRGDLPTLEKLEDKIDEYKSKTKN